MPTQAFSDDASPASTSSADCSLPAFVQMKPGIVTLPYRMLLHAMLEDLRLPKAEYVLQMHEDGTVRMSILLKPPVLRLDGFNTDMWIYGIWSMSSAEAEDSASMEAITFLEKANNVIIKDVNYHRLKHLEEQNEDLTNELKEVKQQREKLARGWFLAVRNMNSFSRQILSMVLLNHSSQDGPMDEIWNNLLCNFAGLGYSLKNIGISLEKRLQKLMGHV